MKKGRRMINARNTLNSLALVVFALVATTSCQPSETDRSAPLADAQHDTAKAADGGSDALDASDPSDADSGPVPNGDAADGSRDGADSELDAADAEDETVDLPPPGFEYARYALGDHATYGTAVAVLSDGGAVVTGHFAGTTTFGRGEPNETSVTARDNYDVFVAAYDADGALRWARRDGGSEGFTNQGDFAAGIARLPNDAVVVVGTTRGPTVFGEGESVESTRDSSGLFAARFDADGHHLGTSFGGNYETKAKDVAALDDGGFVVSAVFDFEAVFNKDKPNEMILSAESESHNAIIIRYNADGTMAWVRKILGDVEQRRHKLAIGPDGSVYLAGHYYSGPLRFEDGTGGRHEIAQQGFIDYCYLAKYDTAGQLSWVRSVGKVDDTNHCEQLGGIDVAPDGTVYLSGDTFIEAFSPAGQRLWLNPQVQKDEWPYDSLKYTTIVVLDDGTLVTSGDSLFGTDLFLGADGELLSIPIGLYWARYESDGTFKQMGMVTEQYRQNSYGPGMSATSGNGAFLTSVAIGDAVFMPGTPHEWRIDAPNDMMFVLRMPFE